MFSQNMGSFSRRMLCRAIPACLLSLALLSPQHILAWGNSGHESVAYVAWQQMSPAARSRAIALIKLVPTLQNPEKTKSIPGYAEWVMDLPAGLSADQKNLYLFMRAATWPDSIKHQWLHDSDTPPSGSKNPDVNIGFTDTASHGYWHFVDQGFTSDGSPVPATPVPNAATQIVALRQAIGSNESDDLKSYDMIWLEHLVGDIHQPLHGSARYFQGKGDEGGNTVTIKMPLAMEKKFEGTQSKSSPRELHAFWDDLPGEGQPAPALPDAVTFAKALPQAGATTVKNIDPSQWAMDSFHMAMSDAYMSPIGKGPTPAVTITQAYYDAAMKDAKSQIALAGARLAKLLNENLH
ncbi:MAG TPA: S1/P1 nuclease [Bryobacteraceae bacterium]|jgi:hypothetical protein